MLNIRGDHQHDVASCIHPIMVTSTRQGSVPFAPFAGSNDTLVAVAVVTKHSLSAVNRCPMYCGLSGEFDQKP